MLEEIKEVLIKEKKEELERKKKIDNEIKKTLLEIDEKDNRTMNEILYIQYEKEALNKKALNRIFNHKKVLELESKIEKLTKENNAKINYKVEFSKGIVAPVKKGDKIGEIIYYSNNKEIARCNVIANNDVEKAGLCKNIGRLLQMWVK